MPLCLACKIKRPLHAFDFGLLPLLEKGISEPPGVEVHVHPVQEGTLALKGVSLFVKFFQFLLDFIPAFNGVFNCWQPKLY